MTARTTIWQSVLNILSDGNRHTAGEMADRIGSYENSVERQIHDLRKGEKPGGIVDIKSAPVPGKPYHEYWVERAVSTVGDAFVAECIRIRDTYPDGHREWAQIDVLIRSTMGPIV